MKRILLALLAVLAIVLVACDGDAAGSPSGAAAQASDEATEPSEEASEAAEESQDDGGGTEPSMQAGAGDLDAVLPDEVGGITIEYESASGEEVLGEDGMTAEMRSLLEAVGADESDLSSAIGVGVDADAGSFISIVALRVSGADETRLRDEFRRTIQEENEEMEITEDNVAGKDVLTLTDPDSGQSGGYLYVQGDILFLVGATPESLAEEALEQLP